MTLRLSNKDAAKLGLIEKSPRGTRITTGAHRPGSWEWAVSEGWQLTYHHIGNGKVSCRAHSLKRGLCTKWLTDATDGRGAVLAALARGETEVTT